ncbi:MAG: hypothetical protein ABIT71_08945 [Vicinamibacteraceae bacterium]
MIGRGPALMLAALATAVPAMTAAQGLGTSRVSTASATIYARCDPSSPPRATLRKGEAVTIEAVNEGWISVRVDASGERGCLKRSDLEPTGAMDRATDARRAREVERARGGSGRGPALPSPTGRPLRIAVFATAGVFNATAKESFAAVLDTSHGTEIGAGGQIAWQSGALRGLFVEVDASRFEETGERAFVLEGEVFPLGIPLTIGLTPIELSAGYRLNTLRRTRRGVVASPVAYFVGGGIGSVGYRETDADESISERFTSYHVMGGADVTVWRMFQVGAEARYRWVPDGLGAGGISDEFNETDLGGTTFRVRIGIGF